MKQKIEFIFDERSLMKFEGCICGSDIPCPWCPEHGDPQFTVKSIAKACGVPAPMLNSLQGRENYYLAQGSRVIRGKLRQ